jgi:hypothetical protein
MSLKCKVLALWQLHIGVQWMFTLWVSRPIHLREAGVLEKEGWVW